MISDTEMSPAQLLGIAIPKRLERPRGVPAFNSLAVTRKNGKRPQIESIISSTRSPLNIGRYSVREVIRKGSVLIQAVLMDVSRYTHPRILGLLALFVDIRLHFARITADYRRTGILFPVANSFERLGFPLGQVAKSRSVNLN